MLPIKDLKTDYDLIVFDLDGTLAEFKTGNILPNVREWAQAWKATAPEQRPRLALASNQGGVGLRFWMESEGFGTPSKYPTQQEAANHVAKVLGEIGFNKRDMRVYMCFAYQSKKTGMYSPVPHNAVQSIRNGDLQVSPRWSTSHRKPRPGMLNDAIEDAGVDPSRTLMIGDWDDDRIAANQAWCKFMWADKFFERT